MARISVATQPIVKAGLLPVLTAPNADGDIIDTGRVFELVRNTGAAPAIVTVQTPVQVDGLAVEDLDVTVPAGEDRMIGPLSPSTFGQPAGDPNAGRALVDYNGSHADILRGVFAL